MMTTQYSEVQLAQNRTLIQYLNEYLSDLQAKELELLEVEQVEQILAKPTLAAPEYRKWRRSNGALLQEIAQRVAAAEQT